MIEINCRGIREKKLTKLKNGVKPSLCIFQIQGIDASDVYVRNKIKTLESIGFRVEHKLISPQANEEDVMELINVANNNKEVDGILLQLPLPNGLDETKLINTIAPHKDVDCLTDVNQGRIMRGDVSFLPCTVQAIIDILKDEQGKQGDNVLVIGRSRLVGMPLAVALTQMGMTVTTAHSQTDREVINKKYDYVITATGKIGVINPNNLHDYSTYIDVGINRNENGKLCGDILHSSKYYRATPVPRGVGILTTVCVAENLVYLKTKYKR